MSKQTFIIKFTLFPYKKLAYFWMSFKTFYIFTFFMFTILFWVQELTDFFEPTVAIVKIFTNYFFWIMNHYFSGHFWVIFKLSSFSLAGQLITGPWLVLEFSSFYWWISSLLLTVLVIFSCFIISTHKVFYHHKKLTYKLHQHFSHPQLQRIYHPFVSLMHV